MKLSADSRELTALIMVQTNSRLSSIKDKTAGVFCCVALACTLVLFLVGTVNAQARGPQASRLIGTIQSDNFTGAVFSDSKGEQSFYRTFDTLPDVSQLVSVRSDSILLRGTDGMSYDMYIAHDMTLSTIANTAAPVRPDVPADPFAPGAIQSSDSENNKVQTRPRGRRGRANTDEE